MSEQEIHNEILNDISDSYDKTTGSFTYDLTRPPAKKIAEAYNKRNALETKLNIENLSGEDLELRIHDRTGIERRKATHAIAPLTVNGDGTVNEGDRFETESGIEYEATETTVISGTGDISIKAIESGAIGVVPANQITQIPVTLDGITSVNNQEPTYDGFEAESDADLLQRYYDRIRTPSTSGNRFHYLNWAKEVPGVGDARVFPLWNGDNTVKVVIINSDRLPASVELVNEVQGYLDPGISGLGDGAAPIGAFITAQSATGKGIDVSFSVTPASSFAVSDVEQEVSDRITKHLKEIAFQQDFVSYAQIGAIILGSESVSDYTDLTVNSGTSNVTVGEQEVAILGGVTVV